MHLTFFSKGLPGAGCAGIALAALVACSSSGHPSPHAAPAITSAASADFTEGAAGTFTFVATGFPSPTLDLSGALPPGVTFTPGTGRLAGTPAAGSVGTYPLTLTASNHVTPDATQSFSLVVLAPATAAPAITSADHASFAEGSAGTFTLTATGTPAPTLALASGTLPAGVTFTAATGVLAGTPASGSAGTYALTFSASNGISPDATQAFTLTVGAGSGTATTFAVPTVNGGPLGIASFSDGKLWFTEFNSGKVASITTTGTIVEYSLGGGGPYGIAEDAGGAPWFTLSTAASLGTLVNGHLNQYPVVAGGPIPHAIVRGLDNRMWFTESGLGYVSSFDTGVASFSRHVLPIASCMPEGLTVGPDGNLWFTEYDGHKIGRMTLTGTVTEFALAGPNAEPWGITAGPDGALWFTVPNDGQVGRITTAGIITLFNLTAQAQPFGITAGPDGALWCAESGTGKLARITTTGHITEFTVGTQADDIRGIATGADGNIWYTAFGGNQVGRFVP